MVYFFLAITLFFWGIGLLLSDTGQLLGAKLPFNFGEYKNLAGVFFLVCSLLLARAVRGKSRLS